MLKLTAAFAAIALIAVPASANAAQCKDTKGKFIKCPPAASSKTATKAEKKAEKKMEGAAKKETAAAKAEAKAVKREAKAAAASAPKKSGNMAGRCRDAKGRFAKCGTPGAKPA